MKISILSAAVRNSRELCSKTYAGSASHGRKGRIAAAHSRRIRKANVAILISRRWEQLRDGGFIYPCTCSRKDLAESATAPNDSDGEPIYPGKCRSRTDARDFETPAGVNWRFRVPDGEKIAFLDQHLGPQGYVAGRDFGDFVVWRRDDVPAYQLAVVADDHAMKITEVVRGADLLKSTARQLLLYRASEIEPPDFYHYDLVRDENGVRLAKRHDALGIRKLRESGMSAEEIRNLAVVR